VNHERTRGGVHNSKLLINGLVEMTARLDVVQHAVEERAGEGRLRASTGGFEAIDATHHDQPKLSPSSGQVI
jgi:hypothetical protein